MFENLRKKLKSFSKTVEEKVIEKGKAAIGGETILDEKDLKKPLEELEVALLESDTALSVVEELIRRVKAELVGKKVKRGTNTEDLVENTLKGALLDILSTEKLDFDEFVAKGEKPLNLAFIGVNGTGKTTTIAKVAQKLLSAGHSVVIAAADTYRAGATEQIECHASNLGIKLIKH
ncbi:MAG: signal recognition particle receptor subunit alpha, partial [Methanosarcinales archaeon]